MDINKENEVLQENDVQEEVISEIAEDGVQEEILSEIREESDENEFVDVPEYSTVSVDREDIDQELVRYGITDGAEKSEEAISHNEDIKSKCPVQKPIIIAALAFFLTAVVIISAMFIYKAVTKHPIIGTWTQAGDYSGNMFLQFEDDGTVSLSMGGVERFGEYEIREVQGYDVIYTEFYELALISRNIIVTYPDEKDTMTLNFIYDGVDLETFDFESMGLEYISMGSIEFEKGKKPSLEIEPDNITHASADEFGITEMKLDEEIFGSWQLEIMGAEGKFETYTFNSDGTGSRKSDYVYYETYACGLGESCNFKYTVYDGKILITYDYFDGSHADIIIDYYMNKGDLVINGSGYEAVK